MPPRPLKFPVAAALLFTAWLGATAPDARASHLSGDIKDTRGQPVPGALVTVTEPKSGAAETVYSNAQGEFQLWTGFSGKVNLRVRHPRLKDFSEKGVGLSPERVVSVHVQLIPFTSAGEESDSRPAITHAARIGWLRPALRTEFVSQCNYCHQIGNALTRRPRPLPEWQTTVTRMESMGSLLTWDGRANIGIQLFASFKGAPLENLPPPPELDPAVYSAKVQEWTLGEPLSFVHDLEAAASGKLYAIDMSYDRLYELDPVTGQQRQWSFPTSPLPLGGLFSSSIHPLGTFGATYGPHGLQEDAAGRLWIVDALSSQLTVFDPRTGAFRNYDVPGGAVYPHTLRFDARGRIWFTVAVSNQVAMFDPKTEKFELINLPSEGWVPWFVSRFARRLLKFTAKFPQSNLQLLLSPHNVTGTGTGILNLPYGIDVNPKDGSIWYSKLYEGKIGRIDPDSFAIEEFKTPLKGPRRMRFDRDGGLLWIPSFVESALMSFDPKSHEFKTYPIPTPGPGEVETPYAVNVDPRTHDVWVTGGASDRLLRFTPGTAHFTAYPLPTRVTFMRELVFTKEGKVCATYSNLPAHAIEGGRPKLMCLQP